MAEATGRGTEASRFDPSYATRMVSDLVQNPWVAREVVGQLLEGLQARGSPEQRLGENTGLLVEELRKWLTTQQIERAEKLFRDKVAAGEIQFRLRLDTQLNWSMPFTMPTTEHEGARQIAGSDGQPLQKSLFAPVYEAELNTDERDVAVYLDADKALTWWHRNVARSQYALQGWQREKIYPDFVFAVQKDDGPTRIAVLETKGDHLDNADTEYKRQVMQLMTQEFAWDRTVPAGELALVADDDQEIVCKMVLMSEWPTKLPELLSS